MQDALAFMSAVVGGFQSSLLDPVFLVLMGGAVGAALGFRWLGCSLAVIGLATVRVAVLDWEHFSPGVPPSPSLAVDFVTTLIAAAGFLLVTRLLLRLVQTLRERHVYSELVRK